MKPEHITMILRTRQSMEYSRKGSPMPKKCKTKVPAGKAILSVFWNTEGVVLSDFLGKHATMNSELYNEALKNVFKKKHNEEGGTN
jgi:hypothetical protein